MIYGFANERASLQAATKHVIRTGFRGLMGGAYNQNPTKLPEFLSLYFSKFFKVLCRFFSD
jgi:hypothetical protein